MKGYGMTINFLHIGISVKNLDTSVRFYTEVMGMDLGNEAYHKGNLISQVVGVKDTEVAVRYVTDDMHKLELIEYKNKDEAKKQTVYSGQENPGIVHIAYVVDDVDRMFQEIKALGYEFYSAPMVTRENGPKITFFKGPDNVIIELYEKASQ